MSFRRRLVVLVIAIGAISLGLASPALGTAHEAAETTAPAEGATVEDSIDVPTPAVSIVQDAAADSTPEWTFRFLVPITMLLGGLVVVGTIIAYFVKVTRQRYRVVE